MKILQRGNLRRLPIGITERRIAMDIIKYDMRKRNYIDFNLRQYVSELFNEIPHEHKQITIGFSRDVATHLTETVEAILYKLRNTSLTFLKTP
jgi:hypothetical protein